MLKKKILILIMIVCFMAISTVSAEDVNNLNNTGVLDDSINYAESSENLYSLSQLIDSADDGSTLVLENDYIYENYRDINIIGGINITKEITIEGQGHILSGDFVTNIFNVYADNVVLNNISFKNCYHSDSFYDSGGAIKWYGANGLVSNSYFENNICNRGGSIVWNGINGTVTDCIFEKNSASSGGAIYWNNTNGLIINSIFLNNCEPDIDVSFGGAIYCNSNNLRIIKSTFKNNYANYGGVIFIRNSGNKILDSKFINNTATAGSALNFGQSINSENNLIYNCSFINNSATSRSEAGTIYWEGGKNNKIDECLFVNNSAWGLGGVIRWRGITNNTITNSIFVSNKVYSHNSNVFFWGDNSSLINSSFINNSVIAVESWENPEIGALSMNGDNCIIDNVSFINNSAGYCAGALYYGGNNNLLNNSVFINNTAIGKEVSYGGAADIGGENMLINKCMFINNFADDGGAIGRYLAKKTYIKDSIFINCSSDSGSAIYPYGDMETFNCTFIPNEHLEVISIQDIVKYYRGPENLVVKVRENNGNPIHNADVTITINGKSYTRTTDNNGVASMAINLDSGVYNVTTEYGEIKSYSTITINPTIVAKDFTKIFRNDTQYYGKFTDSQGNLLNNADVNFNINGVFYTRTTDDQGVAKMNINLNPGTYILTATNPSNGEMQSTTIKVLSSIVENYDLTKYYKNDSQYSVRLLDAQGNPVGAGVGVEFNINGVFYTRYSDANGYVKMNINLNPGTYIITANYNGLMTSNTIKVLPIIKTKDLIMSYRDGSKFEATLLDGKGKPYANQNITFNINGVFYNRLTDDDGIARLNINLMAGEYIITSMYENGAVTSNKVTIRS